MLSINSQSNRVVKSWWSSPIHPTLNWRAALRAALGEQQGDVEFRVNADLLAGARIVVGQQTVVDLSLEHTLADLQAESVA